MSSSPALFTNHASSTKESNGFGKLGVGNGSVTNISKNGLNNSTSSGTSSPTLVNINLSSRPGVAGLRMKANSNNINSNNLKQQSSPPSSPQIIKKIPSSSFSYSVSVSNSANNNNNNNNSPSNSPTPTSISKSSAFNHSSSPTPSSPSTTTKPTVTKSAAITNIAAIIAKSQTNQKPSILTDAKNSKTSINGSYGTTDSSVNPSTNNNSNKSKADSPINGNVGGVSCSLVKSNTNIYYNLKMDTSHSKAIHYCDNCTNIDCKAIHKSLAKVPLDFDSKNEDKNGSSNTLRFVYNRMNLQSQPLNSSSSSTSSSSSSSSSNIGANSLLNNTNQLGSNINFVFERRYPLIQLNSNNGLFSNDNKETSIPFTTTTRSISPTSYQHQHYNSLINAALNSIDSDSNNKKRQQFGPNNGNSKHVLINRAAAISAGILNQQKLQKISPNDLNSQNDGGDPSSPVSSTSSSSSSSTMLSFPLPIPTANSAVSSASSLTSPNVNTNSNNKSASFSINFNRQTNNATPSSPFNRRSANVNPLLNINPNQILQQISAAMSKAGVVINSPDRIKGDSVESSIPSTLQMTQNDKINEGEDDFNSFFPSNFNSSRYKNILFLDQVRKYTNLSNNKKTLLFNDSSSILLFHLTSKRPASLW
jgi:hypothetical protein